MRKFLVITLIGMAVCIWGYGIINNFMNKPDVEEVYKGYVVVEVID